MVSVSTSRSRDGLETYQRLVSVSSRSKCPTSRSRLGLSDLCVSDLVSFSTQNVSGLVEGVGPFRLVETFHAGAPNLTTPMKTRRPMPYSVGRVLGTVCLDGYQSINQSLFVSGNKNPYYLGLKVKESKLERKYT